ncbi:MAG: response regulator [SAR324 cluster bacterium]|nr:response regulator [SAR324 cluster bacterium]
MGKILVVDDEPANLKQVKTHLTSFGYESATLPKAEFLFKRLESEGPVQESFDLILLDINMPGIDGITALKRLKNHPEHQKIPVIMLTGETREQLIAECFEYGATDFITKPISEIILKARIRTALAAKATNDQLESLVKERTAELGASHTKLEHINEAFQLFVPKQFLQVILSKQQIQSGQFEEANLTILFSDIRSYTHHVEYMTSKENFDFLNEYFNLMEPPVSKNQGFVDKFIGDAMMALFDQEQSADQAVQSAIEMQNLLHLYNRSRKKKGLPEIYTGIGINTGPVMLGALGSEHRLNSTVIGDHVNLASRIETLTKKFNSRILISHHTFAALDRERYAIREIDTVRVKGRTEPVLIYEVFDCDPPNLKEKKEKTRNSFFRGIALYKSQLFAEAQEAFQECLTIFPQDVIVLDYIKRCRYFEKYAPVVDDIIWHGIVKDSDLLVDQVIRRRAERHVLGIPAAVYPYGVDYEYTGRIHDISMDGMKLELELPLQIGDVLLVEICFEKTAMGISLDQQTHRILGRVAWNRQNIPSDLKSPWQIGVQTIMMTLEQEEFLRNTLERLQHQSAILIKSYRLEKDKLVFKMEGKLTQESSHAIKIQIRPLIEDPQIKGVVLNFASVNVIDSSGIALVISIFKALREQQAKLVLCELHGAAQASLMASQLNQIIPIYATEAEALAQF